MSIYTVKSERICWLIVFNRNWMLMMMMNKTFVYFIKGRAEPYTTKNHVHSVNLFSLNKLNNIS